MIKVSFLKIRMFKAVSISELDEIRDDRRLSLTGIRYLRDFEVLASEGREDQRDVRRASIFRSLRRQDPFTDKEEVREKEYMSAGVSHRLTNRFGSEVDGDI